MKTDPPGSMVPPMVVVHNSRTTPLSAEDGEVVARLPACPDGTSHSIQTGASLSPAGTRAFPDAGAGIAASPPIRLRHPESGAPRLTPWTSGAATRPCLPRKPGLRKAFGPGRRKGDWIVPPPGGFW
ncbi:MAG: hypothetical protein U0790_09665 [Isosphaeraceae bacterium]